MMNKVSESIFNGKNVTLPMADVQHIEKVFHTCDLVSGQKKGDLMGLMNLPKTPDGNMKDLDNSVTTMWHEPKQCPNNPEHKITGSSRRYYCADCGVWWCREGWRRE
jgi:hypothetical protein